MTTVPDDDRPAFDVGTWYEARDRTPYGRTWAMPVPAGVVLRAVQRVEGFEDMPDVLALALTHVPLSDWAEVVDFLQALGCEP